MKVLVLGATGLLGNAMFRVLSQSEELRVYGTARNAAATAYFSSSLVRNLVNVQDLEDPAELVALLDALSPDVIINCTAPPKMQELDLARTISIFSLLPHRLEHLCNNRNIRLIQISSDGIFSGKKGGYTENDLPDATDSYGIAKFLGEVDGPQAVTLRTSIIGHDLESQNGLLAWFLQQGKECRCYTHAIFSGYPTVILSQIVRDLVLPNTRLQGIYHVASQPISKFDLLALVRQQYGLAIHMIPDDSVEIDRTLRADQFQCATGYTPPSWPEMVATMHTYKFGLRRN